MDVIDRDLEGRTRIETARLDPGESQPDIIKRGRRIVARTACAPYPRPDLEACAEEIGAGWWADLTL